eukprot:UN25826
MPLQNDPLTDKELQQLAEEKLWLVFSFKVERFPVDDELEGLDGGGKPVQVVPAKATKNFKRFTYRGAGQKRLTSSPSLSSDSEICMFEPTYDEVCFDGYGEVILSDGSTKLVKSLQIGDEVRTWAGATTVVVCRAMQNIESTFMCKIDNVYLTPKHPVFLNGQWVRPCTVSQKIYMKVGWIYNFVLESGHVLFINQLPCITLGHDEDILPQSFLDKDVPNLW